MKKTLILSVLITTMATALSQTPEGFTATWNNGFTVTDNDRFALKFGGRIMFDMATYSPNEDFKAAFGDINGGTRFRRARFFSSGTVYTNVKYKLQLDFGGGNVSFKDAYIEMQKIPVLGQIRAGNFKDPTRLEVQTSSKYITFMERSFLEKFAQERNTGLMIHSSALSNKISWQLAFLGNAGSSGDDREHLRGTNVTARIAGTPLWNKDSRSVIHLGTSFSHRNPDGNLLSIRLIPESSLAPSFVKTGLITDINHMNLMAFEAACVFGSLSAQTEFVTTDVDIANSASMNFSTFYIQASYFLTGESRNYKNSYSGFDRVKPRENAGEGGPGAWQIAVRYATADLEDGNPEGGVIRDITFGLNWHLNPVARIMLNYVNSDVEDVGKVDIFQTRFQIDF